MHSIASGAMSGGWSGDERVEKAGVAHDRHQRWQLACSNVCLLLRRTRVPNHNGKHMWFLCPHNSIYNSRLVRRGIVC
jgi:hypothetical protein